MSAAGSALVWVDRHLHKNGGSTIREIMLRNEEAGRCVYYGYTQTREGWDRLMRELTRHRPWSHGGAAHQHSNASSLARPPSLCIEAHASQASAEFTSRRIPDLLRLRAHLAALALPARVVLTTRVREPLSYYISFYRWRVAGMQRAGNVIRLSASRSVVQPLGSSFLDWTPPNLQSVGLLHGDVELFAGLKAGGYPGVTSDGRRPHPYWVRHHAFGEADYAALVRALDDHYDVVAPLERFDEALLLTADAAGLPAVQSEEHARVVPGPQGMRGLRLADTDVCPNVTSCRAHIAAVAPYDLRLYAHVRQAFAARVGAHGSGPAGAHFGARLAHFRAARAAGASIDVGGGSGVGVCTPPGCCCVDRLPCFNVTGRERRYRVPPACVPGERRVQLAVASDMPLGWCCTNRPPARGRSRSPRSGADGTRSGRGKGRGAAAAGRKARKAKGRGRGGRGP